MITITRLGYCGSHKYWGHGTKDGVSVKFWGVRFKSICIRGTNPDEGEKIWEHKTHKDRVEGSNRYHPVEDQDLIKWVESQ
ncbi:hypothetical protein D3C87_666320 [compost metagenome]